MRTLPCILALLTAASGLAAQGAPPREVPVNGTPADSVQTVLDELSHLAPSTDGPLAVHGLTLSRGGATITLDSGVVEPLSPVNGRVIGVIFAGAGHLRAVPSTAIERAQLKAHQGSDTLDEPFGGAVLLFADSTRQEIAAHSTPAAASAHMDRSLIGDVLDILGWIDRNEYDPDFLGPILNAETSGFFYGYLKMDQGQPLALRYDPDVTESTKLLVQVARTGMAKRMAPLASYPAPGAPPAGGREVRRTDAVSHYAMDLRLPESGGSLAYFAQADLTIAPDGPEGPWVPFELDGRLIGDSASIGGRPTGVWKVKDLLGTGVLWVRLDRRLAVGDTATVRVWYHGNFIDRFGDWFLVDPATAWYPFPTDERNLATFDLTLHTPSQYPVLSVGTRTDSTPEAGHMLRTRWVMDTPIRNAAFNLGVFKESVLTADGVPPITYIYSDHAIKYHIGMEDYVITPDRKERERVGIDVQEALKFFTTEFGGPPVDKFYVAPIPYGEGIAFPGMIDLSMSTFEGGNGSPKGFDQFFRAHEVSHQWWGIGVDFRSYRDQWLSEGLATFSGLWFMQVGFHDPKLYFDYLDRYRDHIVSVADAGPVAIGYRTSTDKHPTGYQTLIYEKGAWMAHMIRILMLDLRTMNEDGFTKTMQDFYQTYHGSRASTADFQHVVERHIGIPMGWFFKEYYEGTALPAYQTAWKAERQP
ncbi:MAG: M1 family aminopeptidase, partial [Gemmatimonadales bacterium]